MNTLEIQSQFALDVVEGLSKSSKTLPSKYFYDSIGGKLFQKIMRMPEYYLTACELEIFQNKHAEILTSLGVDSPFNLIELGAGDGVKSSILLKKMLQHSNNFTYKPIDIDSDTLNELTNKLNSDLPALKVIPQKGDFFKMLNKISSNDTSKNIVFFLGSNIGNYANIDILQFLKNLQSNLNVGDILFLGADLKKDPSIVLDAYNDASGITAQFNLNILNRINKALEADFNLKNFKHYPIYNPHTGQMLSYIMCSNACEVKLLKVNKTFTFNKWETIHLEISRKFSVKELDQFAHDTGFEVISHFFDDKNYFVNTCWKVKA